jgi:uncharacterized protein YebE (UPF0316 family)
MTGITSYIIIFLIKFIGGGLANYRLIMMKEGNRLGVMILTVFTSLSWILSMGLVVGNFNEDFFVTIPFLLGVVGGNYLGMYINNKIKTGHILTTIIVEDNEEKMIEVLQNLQFDIKVFKAKGRDNNKKVVLIKTKSSEHNNLVQVMKDLNVNNFLINERIEGVY